MSKQWEWRRSTAALLGLWQHQPAQATQCTGKHRGLHWCTCARARPPAAVLPSRSSFLSVENSVLVRPCTCGSRGSVQELERGGPSLLCRGVAASWSLLCISNTCCQQ